MITINPKQLEAKDQLKLRMLQAKIGLPKKGYVALFKHYYPDTKYTKLELSQAWTCRLMNLDILEKFEYIKERLKTD